jgi:hypothetical protein
MNSYGDHKQKGLSTEKNNDLLSATHPMKGDDEMTVTGEFLIVTHIATDKKNSEQ